MSGFLAIVTNMLELRDTIALALIFKLLVKIIAFIITNQISVKCE